MTPIQVPRNKAETVREQLATVRALWATMCKADSIPENSKFVVFSEATLAAFGLAYDKAIASLRESWPA